MPTYPFALQLYSIRDHLERDPAATLRAVREMGYEHVETAGSAGLSAGKFMDLLRERGLRPISAHIPFVRVVEETRDVIAECEAAGISYAVVPWVGGEDYGDADAWARCAEQLEQAGAAFAKADIRLCYHNHQHEFTRYGGRTALEILMEGTSPEHLGLELDVCWAHIAGEDPVALIRQYAARLPLLHVKDYRKDAAGPVFTELGRGIVHQESVLEAGRAAGVLWYVVEQDTSEGDSLESARANAGFMLETA